MTDLEAIKWILFAHLVYLWARDSIFILAFAKPEHPDPAVREYLKKHSS